MVARHYYRNDDGDLELVPLVLRWGWSLKESSEEGEAPIVTVVVDDPDMSQDFVGHRRWIVRDDESEDAWDDDVIYSGFVQKQTVAHKGGEITNPLGRVWTIELVDMNTLWTNRILVGSDTKRPAESDVERMTWLVGTEEMGYFDDISLISSSGAVDMDKDDTRGRTTGSVADSCAQQSGKNWWIGARNTGIFVWYGKDTYAGYDSPLALSNDPAVLDMPAVDAGTATTYPLGGDTELVRDPQRIYSGAYVEYQKGAVYRKDTGTEAMFSLSGRDIASPAPEIRTKTKAIARALRILADSDSQELVISTTVTIPARKVSQIRTGMRIVITATHETDGFADGKLCRILNASATPISNGSWYTVAIEAIPVGDPPAPLSCSTALSTIELETATALGIAGGPPVASTITPTFDGRIIAINYAGGENTPNANTMSSISGGYTELLNEPDISRSTYRVAHKAASSGVASTATSSTYTRSFADADQWWSIQLAIQTAGGAPVQTKYANSGHVLDLDSTPTPGNILILFRTCDSAGAGVPDPVASGWTTIFHDHDDAPSNLDVEIGLFARCVEEGDGTHWDFNSAGSAPSQSNYLMEWEIT